MKFRTLGSTGLRVSEIGFGTGDNAGLFVKGDRKDQFDALARAVEHGVNYFDTSPDYGKGLSERNLGEALATLRAQDAIVCSKVEFYDNHIGNMDRAVEVSVDASLARLQRDHIDVLMVHNPLNRVRSRPWSGGWMPITLEEMLGPIRDGLNRVVDSGKVRFVGMACEHSEPEPTREAFAAGACGVANVWLNLTNPSAARRFTPSDDIGDDYTGILDDAAKHDVGTTIIRPLAGGALTAAGVTAGATARHSLAGGEFSRRPELYDSEVRRARRLASLPDQLGMGLVELSYRFLLSCPEVSLVIGGFSDVGQLAQTIEIAKRGPLNDEDLRKLTGILTGIGQS